MSTTAAGDGPGKDQDRPQPPKRRGLMAATWLLPVAALIIGVLIGFVIWGTTNNDDGPTGLADGTPAPTSSATESGSAGATVTVAVPQSCLDAVDEAQASLDLLDQATQAISELDAARLQTIVDDLQSASERVRALGEECRASADVTVEGTTASPTS